MGYVRRRLRIKRRESRICHESLAAKLRSQKRVLIVSLKPNLAQLHSPSRQASLENAFSQFNGAPVKLKLIEGSEESPETPTQNRARHDSEEKAEVYQTLMEDPMVKDIMERFDATVVPDSIRPGKQQGRAE